MYEQLVNELVSHTQVDRNLHRTISKGLISYLNKRQMSELALKYFGIDKNGNYTSNKDEIINYRCPYTGEIGVVDLHLDHILPFSSNGGTVLFNCIPVSNKANLSKNDTPNLIDWWIKQPFFDYDRLERLIQYILEAYEVNDSNTINNDYGIEERDLIEENENLFINECKYYIQRKISSDEKITYYQLIKDLINILSEDKDVTIYNDKLEKLKNDGKFGEIEKIENIVVIVQNIIKEIVGEDSRKYLSYSLGINFKRLLDSLSSNNYESEIRKRFDTIISIVEKNNISLIDYFENMRDLEDIDLLYFDTIQISEKSKAEFVENIKIGHNTKILMLIDMIKYAKTSDEIADIYNGNKIKHFTTYKKGDNEEITKDKEYGTFKGFWKDNKEEIQTILDKLISEDIDFRNKMDEFYIDTYSGQLSQEGKKRRQEIFIDMIRHAKDENEIAELFYESNSKHFTTYKRNNNGEWVEDKVYSLLGTFWSTNKDIIQPIIDNLSEYDIELRDKMDSYYINTVNGMQTKEGIKRRQEIFIDMLRHTKSSSEVEELFDRNNNRKFTTYKKNENGEWIVDREYDNITNYWQRHKNELQPIIEELVKEDVELRDNLDEYYMNTFSGQNTEEGKKRRQEIFIDMLRHAKSSNEIAHLFAKRHNVVFTTYKKDTNGEWVKDKEYGSLSGYWNPKNRIKIQPILDEICKDDIVFRDKMDEYYMNTFSGQLSQEGKKRRLEIFIEMIKRAKDEKELDELFSANSTKEFTTYRKDTNGEWVKDKEYGSLSGYWNTNRIRIQPIIDQLSEEDIELREKLDRYYMMTINGQKTIEGRKRRQEVFIDMIVHSKSAEEIAKLFSHKDTTGHFVTYKKDSNGEWIVDKEYGSTYRYWQVHKEELLPLIDKEIEVNPMLRDKLDNFYISTYSGKRTKEGIQRQMEVFIDMLKNTSRDELLELFNQRSSKEFTTYKKDESGKIVEDKKYGTVSGYWQYNGIAVIIPNLFCSDKYADSSYDVARKNVIIYLNYLQNRKKLPEFNNIYEYILTLDTTKKEVQQLIEFRDQMLERKNNLIFENEQLKEQLDSTSVRRAV